MKSRLNLAGKSFGWWKVIKQSERKNRNGYFWHCICKCGSSREVHCRALQTETSRGCGCSRLEKNRREKFFKKKYSISENGCWEWKGCKDVYGYGLYGRKTKSHRYSYTYHKGEFPKGMCVCHTCDNPGCVNPEHLFLSDNKGNQRDKILKKRQSTGEKHGSAKLSENQAIEIISRSKEMGTVLAKEFGVTSGLIYAIRKNRIWKHLPRPHDD